MAFNPADLFQYIDNQAGAWLFLGLIFFILHVTGSGSFPRPLTAQEERDCLERMRKGDLDVFAIQDLLAGI